MADEMLFTGTGTALVTPFTDDDQIDVEAWKALINRQIEAGIDALIVLGTTGENPTVSDAERQQLVELAIEESDGRAPVVVGTGTNSTRQSVEYSRQAAEAGADGLLVVGPYYNKPMQKGFAGHVKAIADAVDTPIMLYNVPGRTSFNFTPQTAVELAEEVPSVVGVKEASGDLAQITDLITMRPEGLAVYSGDDELTLPMMALGAEGVVSVLSNAMPAEMVALVDAAAEGDLERAREMHFQLLPAMRACFDETNPIPIKAVMADRGEIRPNLRLPLQPMNGEVLNGVLDAFGRSAARR